MHRSARDLGPDDLILSTFSLQAHVGPAERVEAAARAGFDGIGWYVGSVERWLADGWTIPALRSLLRDNGVVLAELEAIRVWDGSKRSLRYRSLALEIGEALEVRYLQAVGPCPDDLGEAADGFGALCDEAAERGLLVGIEFLPQMSNIEDAATALAIVDRAGRANGGVCVDAWHHVRGANDLAMLGPGGPRILAVQLSDGPAEPVDADYATDTMNWRLPPGEGTFDLLALIRTLDDAGSTAPLSAEVCGHAMWSLSPAQAAQRLHDALSTVRAQARSSPR